MINAQIYAALIQAGERDLVARIERPRAPRPAGSRRSPHLPRVIVTLRALRTRAGV